MAGNPAENSLRLLCEYEGSAEKITIIPRIESSLALDQIFIASFHIDSLEMASSARLLLTKEKPFAEFPEKPIIFRVLFWYPRNMGPPAFYTFKTVFFQNAREDFSLTCRLGFSLPEAEFNGKEYLFSIQKKPFTPKRFLLLTETSESLKRAITSDRGGNFFLLPEEEKDWENLLTLCDTYGIAGGLLLKEGEKAEDIPPELFHHPSLLFLFSPDLAGGGKEEFHISPLRKVLILPSNILQNQLL